MRLPLRLLTLLLAWVAFGPPRFAQAQTCATAGKDGAATLTTNPNAYYPSTAAQTLAVNATTISVGAARGAATSITPGDLLLVIQMQGADINPANTDSYGDGVAGGPANGSVTTNFTAGTYEYVLVAAASATVTAAAGGTVTVATGLKNSCANAVATGTTSQRTFQVIRVPQYTNVTLSANIVPRVGLPHQILHVAFRGCRSTF